MQYDLDENSLPVGMRPEEGETIEITRKKSTGQPLPPYNVVGNGLTSRHGTSVDVLELCLQMNLSEMRLLQFFRNCFSMNVIRKESAPSVIEPLKWQEFDRYLRTALMKNYSHLEFLGVLKRMKRGTYILNPKVFLPPRDYLAMLNIWEQTKVKED